MGQILLPAVCIKIGRNFVMVIKNHFGGLSTPFRMQLVYRKAADQGYAGAQFNLGFMYANGRGVAKDEVEAVKWLRKAADQGNANAQSNLGNMYWVGNGVVKDELEAYKWFLLSGAQGNEGAKKEIPIVEKDLTATQRLEGQRLAREWKSKK